IFQPHRESSGACFQRPVVLRPAGVGSLGRASVFYPDFPLVLFALCHSVNDCAGGVGILRFLCQGLNLLLTAAGRYFMSFRPARPAPLKMAGLDKTQLIIRTKYDFNFEVPPRNTISCRHLYNCSCILIFTGHTCEQEPHKVEAKGRSEYFFKSHAGDKIEPIGPAMEL